VPVEDYRVPTALFSGDIDKLGDPVDVAWITKALGDNIVFAKEYHLDHFSFAIAKDMSFFTEDAVSQILKYNPLQ